MKAPGPTGIPLIGPVAELAADPLRFLQRVSAEYGDVVRFREGPTRWVTLFSHPDHIEQILVKQHKKLMKDRVTRMMRRALDDGLVTSEGQHWRRQRKLASPAFTRTQIALYGDQMVRLTADAIEHWEPGEVRDVHEDMMALTMEVISAVLFSTGSTPEVQAVVTESLDTLFTEFDLDVHSWRLLLPQWVPTSGRRRVEVAKQRLHVMLDERIAAGRAHTGPSSNLLGQLLAVRDDDGTGMEDTELREELLTLFVAGHETTALTLFFALHLVGRHPEVGDKARAEIDEAIGSRLATVDDMPALPYIHAIVQEAMRVFPPVWIIGREVIEPFEVGGVALQPGNQILCSQWVVHKDPRWWPEPEQFNPDRWLSDEARSRFSYFPFGGGPRVCIGNHFAMMEAVLLLTTMLQRVRHMPEAEGDPGLTPSITIRPISHTKMRVQMREMTVTGG
jgi:cytochrome P450